MKRLGFLAVLFALAATAAAAETPKVVASIVPVHGLVAAVMKSAGEPRLIAAAGASPHDYALKPSDARALAEASLVFWIGPKFESFMARSVETLAEKARIVALGEAAGVSLLPVRMGGLFAGESDHAENDLHVFLDPQAAIAMTRAIASALSAADPENAARYQANATALAAAIEEREKKIRKILSGMASAKLILYHDATQYFERRFGIPAAGAIAGHDEAPPGAKHVSAIRAYLKANQAACVLHEPDVAEDLIQGLVAGTDAKIVAIDPEGVSLSPGPRAYLELIENLARAFAACR